MTNFYDQENQRFVCRISSSHKGGMHYGSKRVSTDAQQTALQRAALQQAGCTTLVTDEGLSGATVQRPALTRCLTALQPMRPPACAAPACLGAVTHGACVTHLRRGARAREQVTHAVCRLSGVLCRHRDTPRTGDTAVAGPRSPVPLAPRAHPLIPPVRRSRVCRGDCHERAPWYAAHLLVSTACSHATEASIGFQGHHRAHLAS